MAISNPGNIPQHRLRAAGVLRRAAAAQTVKQMKHHRHAGLAAGHGISIGRFVGDLRPGFIDETAGAQVDDRTQSRHRRAGGQAAEAQLRDRRREHPLAEFLLQVLKHMAVRAQTQESPVDQMHALIGAHDLVERLEFGFVVSKFSHNGLLSEEVSLGLFRFRIGAVDGKLDGGGDFGFDLALDGGDFITAGAGSLPPARE